MIDLRAKVRATAAARKAMKRGLIPCGGTCAVCGDKTRTHAHHENYHRPLVVVHLCPICHCWHHRYRDGVLGSKRAGFVRRAYSAALRFAREKGLTP